MFIHMSQKRQHKYYLIIFRMLLSKLLKCGTTELQRLHVWRSIYAGIEKWEACFHLPLPLPLPRLNPQLKKHTSVGKSFAESSSNSDL